MKNKFFHFGKIIKVKFTIGVVFMMSFLFAFHPIEVFSQSKLGIGKDVPNFVLEGADGNKYELQQMRGKLIILVMAPKKTEENNNKWVKILLETFPQNDSLKIFSVFDMRGIPFFISANFVKGKVKEIQKEHPVTILLDWDQKVNKLLDTNKDETDIFVISQNGVLVSHQVGSYSEEKLRLLIKNIK